MAPPAGSVASVSSHRSPPPYPPNVRTVAERAESNGGPIPEISLSGRVTPPGPLSPLAAAVGPSSQAGSAVLEPVGYNPVDGPRPSAPPPPPSEAGSEVTVVEDERMAGLRTGFLAQRGRVLEKRGESLSIMCIGETGVGKSTLIANIFARPLTDAQLEAAGPSSGRVIPPKTLAIMETTTVIRVDSIPITVRMIDTPGFGDLLDIHSSFRSITSYLDRTYEKAFKREAATDRSADYHKMDSDLGVDAVLYFISPHRLKGLDMELLTRLRGRAAIIPIIAKADTMTVDELRLFRAQVSKQLADADIPVFHAPLAIIASPSASGRTYPWGVAESENEAHSDLPTLRRLLLIDGLEDLHDARRLAYERYRTDLIRRLRGGAFRPLINFATTALLYTTVLTLVVPQIRGPVVQTFKDLQQKLTRSVEKGRIELPNLAALPGLPAMPLLKGATGASTANASATAPASATDVKVTVKQGATTGATGTTATAVDATVEPRKGKGLKRVLLILSGIALAPLGFLAFKPPDSV